MTQTLATPRLASSATLVAALLSSALLSGCGGSSSDTDSTGYVKFYNASSNAPYIYLELNETQYAGAQYANSNGIYELPSENYELTLSWKEGSNDYNDIAKQSLQINDEKVSLVVLAGDVANPEVLTYQYDDEDPETEDAQFTFRWLNLHSDYQNVDVYLSKDDETFNEATLITPSSYSNLSDSFYYDMQTYKFYLTVAGSSEVLYESEDIPFIYTSQYIMVIRANNGPGDSPFTIDLLSKGGYGVAYSDVNAGAEVKIYNGLAKNALLPQFNNAIDVKLSGNNGDNTIDTLAKGEFSDTLDFSVGDYAIDIKASEDNSTIALNRFLSLPANSDRTVFVFLTEAEEDIDGNENTADETVLYINTLPVDNSSRISLYDHHIKIVNMVDDFTGLSVYFVRSNETVDTAEYKLFAKSGKPDTITIENNSYDVSLIGSENNSELLLAFDQISLNSESGDLFLLIEEDTQAPSGYSMKFVSQ